MAYDYTDVPKSPIALIPEGTLATVTMHIRPGNAGHGDLLKRSKDGGCEMIDAEFTVVDGEYARRKFWSNMVLVGTTDGHAKAADITKNTLAGVITPDKKEYPVEQPPPFNGGVAAAGAAPSAPAAGAAPIKRPKWSETSAS